MTRRCSPARLWPVLLLLFAAPLLASDSPFLVGAAIAVDGANSSNASGTGEVLCRYRLSPGITLEAGLSYHSTDYRNYRGGSGEAYSLRQVPLLLGVNVAANPGRPVQILTSLGLIASYTHLSYDSYVRDFDSVDHTESNVVVGAFVGLGIEARAGKSLRVLAAMRYVYDPVGLPFSAETRNYVRLSLGLGSYL